MSWKKGPMPADTYGWGGVITKDGHKSGLLFADFCGDHATLCDGTKVKACDVVWYNNSLTLPPTGDAEADAAKRRDEVVEAAKKGFKGP